MWKAIVVHKTLDWNTDLAVKERVWLCSGVTILPGHYYSHSAALGAAKKAKGAQDQFFKDVAHTYNEESLTPTFYK